MDFADEVAPMNNDEMLAILSEIRIEVKMLRKRLDANAHVRQQEREEWRKKTGEWEARRHYSITENRGVWTTIGLYGLYVVSMFLFIVGAIVVAEWISPHLAK